MRREPLLASFLALAAGIVAGHFNYFRLSDLVWPAFFSLTLLVGCLVVSRARRMAEACLLMAIGIIGIGMQVLHRQGPRPRLTVPDGDTALLDGCVIDSPVFGSGKAMFTLQLAPQRAVRVTTVLKNARLPLLSYGERVEVAARIRAPHNFQNPGEFDYSEWLSNQHIYWTASADPTDIHVLGGSCGKPGWRPVFAIRDWALGRLDQLYPNDSETATLLKAILLGQTAGVERRWTSDFRLTGTYHAIVISGQHVAVLALTLLFLLRLLRLGRLPSLSIAVGVSWVYALVTGLAAPVVRAAGSFTLFLGASFLFRRIRILNGLAAIGLVYLLLDPDELFDPSFQLSFLSAAALAVFALPLMERWMEPMRAAAGSVDRRVANVNQDPRIATYRVELQMLAETIRVWFRIPIAAAIKIAGGLARAAVFVAEAIIVSACIQFGLALPMIEYFHRVSFTGLAANIVVVPLLSIVIPTGFGAIFTGWHFLAQATEATLKLAQALAAWHGHLEPSWRIAGVPLRVSLLFCASLTLLALALRHTHRLRALSGFAAVAIFAAICVQPWRPQLRRGWLEVSAIDVSQGDSIFVAFPDGETTLVDAGGFPGLGRMSQQPNLDMGEDVVSPYLWSRSLHHLDYVALTHGHSDHMQGLCAVLNNFHPKKLWIGPEPASAEWRKAQACARAAGTKIEQLSSDTRPLTFGQTKVSVLAPQPDYVAGESAVNNDSLVFLIEMGKRSVLLTGDAEQPIEAELLARCNLKPVTLLKVGHHGSRTSTSEPFLEALKPEFAFISAGYLNQFHHPHPVVLQRLSDEHAMVFRTDRQGLSTFLTDGQKVEVSGFRQ
ncbi:MAG: ComEC/Rec2 family competence protein [Bryobacteraceae bacterium]